MKRIYWLMMLTAVSVATTAQSLHHSDELLKHQKCIKKMLNEGGNIWQLKEK